MLNNLAKTKLLILDDFGLAPLTVIVSQLPVERWHEMLDPLADAILTGWCTPPTASISRASPCAR